MRASIVVVLVSFLCACVSTHTVEPREYLDEKTAATITVVADPWIFANDRVINGDERDFLNIYAIDVNRMGDHRQYLAVLQWWPPATMSTSGAAPTLELRSQDRVIPLSPITVGAREIGIAQPLDTSHPPGAKWWYFPIHKPTLAMLAGSRDWLATLVADNQRIEYVMWRDGRAELAEFSDALQ